MMKTFSVVVISLCLLHNLITQASSEVQLDEDEQSCVVATEISEDIVVEAKETNTVFADDPKYKEFLACLWKRTGYQNEDGQINWENIGEVLKKDYAEAVVKEIIQKCDKIEGKTDGDEVALVLECLDSHAPSHHHVSGFFGGSGY
ncbi:hypothetical protein ILUMI_00046 [Ignelater luminosus]|uniref:Uncharacterized protein n=1 Tax=Ignelater luminosus TaxID=2038154 RepID=A0A8K0DTD3_IGNLU|nr:hypothetical protein ILUMI_00046 [Ignelater luminosus]